MFNAQVEEANQKPWKSASEKVEEAFPTYAASAAHARAGQCEEAEQNPKSILETAIKVTTGDRRRDYDKASSNHERIADGWNWYLAARKDPSAPISALDAAHMMIVLKLARACYTPTKDTYVDIAGYAKCASQISGFEAE